jgi:hypothetical protein
MTWPEQVSFNAWTGTAAASGQLGGESRRWALDERVAAVPAVLAPRPLPELRDWRNPEVGWGLILPEAADDLAAAERAAGADAPEPIRGLLAARGGPVLRYLRVNGRHVLRRHYPDRGPQDLDLGASPSGTGVGQLPRYLLIYASPAQVPWVFQYLLNSGPCMVGRLDLGGDALANYVDHLLHEWDGAAARVERPVVWATDWGQGDITRTMRRLIAEPVAGALRADTQIGEQARYLDGATMDASCAALVEALGERRPGLVVTTSHGMTGPLDDLEALGRNLGRPVDNQRQLLDPDAVSAAWAPDGAIWYAHACCSAGSDDPSQLATILEPGSSARVILEGVAKLGATVAPLPRALLGADKPLRAFIGHVEPTFDWTIQQPLTRQSLAASIRQALYDHLYQPEPVGLALRDWYAGIGTYLAAWRDAVKAYDQGQDTQEQALASQLSAVDRQSMVILGDPTAALPPLPPG